MATEPIPQANGSSEDVFDAILSALPGYRDTLLSIREIVLGNLVMISEIPAPTLGEHARSAFVCQRLCEVGLDNASSDEKGNAVGISQGEGDGERSILVVAHLDTTCAESEDHTVTIRPDAVVGRGVADNGLGLAVLVSLPQILELLNIRLKANLVLLGAASSLGRGNLEGLRFFLQNNPSPIQAGVCLEGVQLGRLNLVTVGMLRGEIVCRVPEEYDWTHFGARGAIMTINEVLDKILAIPLTRRPRTDIVFGSLHAGTSFNTVTTEARLQFEVRGESAELVNQVGARMEEICAEVASDTQGEVNLDIVARRQPGGIDFAHPLARRTRRIMQALEIPIKTRPSTSEVSMFIERHIPAMTIALSTGTSLGQPDENVAIDPVFTGIAQLVGILQAIDTGCCDED